MRHRIARTLRRAANRLDPPMKVGEWSHVTTTTGEAGKHGVIYRTWINGERIA